MDLAMRHGIIFLLVGLIASFGCSAPKTSPADSRLGSIIDSIIDSHDGTAGVAFLYGDEMLAAGDTSQLPLMSVFKIHVAIAVLDKGINLDSLITVDSTNLARNTHSPLRDSIGDASTRITVDRLLYYSVCLSDNNACDILIDLAGGIGRVEDCMRNIGATGCTLTETEATMHADISRSYLNKSTAKDLCRVMEAVYSDKILTPEKCLYMRGLLSNSLTGREKIAAGIPAGALAGHKSGMSDLNAEGVLMATTDVAAITMPDGGTAYLAILVKDTKESSEESAKLFNDVAAAVYDMSPKP